ncbi:MAG: hypothetical protein ACFE0Q_11380 [Anaerolineae bacterium]
MALEHFVYIKAKKTMQVVVEEWFKDDTYDLEFVNSGLPHVIRANHPLFQVSFLDRTIKKPKKTVLGFMPTIAITFRMTHDQEKRRLGFEFLRRTTLSWLENTTDEIVLLSNGDIGVALRVNDEILINPGWIAPKELEHFSLVYKEKPFELWEFS